MIRVESVWAWLPYAKVEGGQNCFQNAKSIELRERQPAIRSTGQSIFSGHRS